MFDAKNCPFLPQDTSFTAFLSQMLRKTQYTRFEDKILGQVSLGGLPATSATLATRIFPQIVAHFSEIFAEFLEMRKFLHCI